MTPTRRLAGSSAVMSLALLALYLAFPTKVYYWDGIVYAQMIEDAAAGAKISLAHPNHLIYGFVGYLLFRMLQVVGMSLRALSVLRILNSVFSAGCAALLFAILRNTLRSTYYSVCLTLLFALSAMWWKFSTDVNPYIPSVFFLLLTFYLVLPDRKSAPLLAALSFVAAMCFHELAVISYPVFALGLYWQEGPLRSRRGRRNVITFSLVTFVLTVGMYAMLFYESSVEFNFVRLVRWAASYSSDADTTFAFWSNLEYSLRGQVRLFFGGRFNLLHGLMNPLIVILIGLFAATVLFLIVAVLRNLATLRVRWREARLEPQQKTILQLASLWLVVYLVFLFFFLPQNTFYRLFYLPAVILMCGVALAALPKTKSRFFATASFVVAVGLGNFLFSIYPFSHVEKYPPLALALQMNRDWPPGTVVYYETQNSDDSLIRYFTRASIWKQLPEQFPAELPASAWLETTAIDRVSSTAEGAQWLKLHGQPATLHELNNGAYRIRFIRVAP
jgi:hypothetical protein